MFDDLDNKLNAGVCLPALAALCACCVAACSASCCCQRRRCGALLTAAAVQWHRLLCLRLCAMFAGVLAPADRLRLGQECLDAVGASLHTVIDHINMSTFFHRQVQQEPPSRRMQCSVCGPALKGSRPLLLCVFASSQLAAAAACTVSCRCMHSRARALPTPTPCCCATPPHPLQDFAASDAPGHGAGGAGSGHQPGDASKSNCDMHIAFGVDLRAGHAVESQQCSHRV